MQIYISYTLSFFIDTVTLSWEEINRKQIPLPNLWYSLPHDFMSTPAEPWIIEDNVDLVKI